MPRANDDGVTTSLDSNFAENLRRVREEAGLSQTSLAERMAASGFRFHQTTVARIEAGKRQVTLGEADALASIFNRRLIDMQILPDEAVARRRLEKAVASAEKVLEELDRWISITFPRAQGEVERALSSFGKDEELNDEHPLVQRARRILAIRSVAGLLDVVDQFAAARRRREASRVTKELPRGEH